MQRNDKFAGEQSRARHFPMARQCFRSLGALFAMILALLATGLIGVSGVSGSRRTATVRSSTSLTGQNAENSRTTTVRSTTALPGPNDQNSLVRHINAAAIKSQRRNDKSSTGENWILEPNSAAAESNYGPDDNVLHHNEASDQWMTYEDSGDYGSWQHDPVANVESIDEPTSLEGRREGPYLASHPTADTGSPLYAIPDEEQSMDALTALRVLSRNFCPGLTKAFKLPSQMISITPWRLILNILGLGQTVGHTPPMSAERRREVDRIRERLRHLNAFMVVFRDMQGSGMTLTERDWAMMNQMQAEIDGLNARLRQLLSFWGRRNNNQRLRDVRRHLRDDDSTESQDILTLLNSLDPTMAGSTGGTLVDGILKLARDFLLPIIDAIGGWAGLAELLLSPMKSNSDNPSLNNSTIG